MNTSCSMPRSRAEGVRIVFGPMKIFSLRVIARRTSFSLTKGEISTAGFGGVSDFGGGADGVGGSTLELLEEAGGKFAAASGFGLPEEPNRRPAISAATAEGLGSSFAAGADLVAPLPRAIPWEAITCSTTKSAPAAKELPS